MTSSLELWTLESALHDIPRALLSQVACIGASNHADTTQKRCRKPEMSLAEKYKLSTYECCDSGNCTFQHWQGAMTVLLCHSRWRNLSSIRSLKIILAVKAAIGMAKHKVSLMVAFKTQFVRRKSIQVIPAEVCHCLVQSCFSIP